MKLTKQKLKQLIMEEFKTMSQKVFDKRRERQGDEFFRAFGDENQPINRPEFHDKLTSLASSDPEGFNQALDFADTLGEPLDRQFSDEMETYPFKDDDHRIREFRSWMVSKGYGMRVRPVVLYKKEKAKQMFKEFAEETKDYRTYNTVVGAYRVDYVPFLDEETGEPLPLGSSRPFRGTNTYHYPRP